MKKDKTKAETLVSEQFEAEEKPQKKSTRIIKIIINSVINILIVFVLIISLLIAIMALSSKANGISSIFGFTIQTIQSDSMSGSSPDGYQGGNINKGDLVIGKATDFDDFAEYEKGDVVTYIDYDDQNNSFLMAHRIVDKVQLGTEYRYQTWGDNREVAQLPDQQYVEEYLSAYRIGSVISSKDYHALVIPGLGGFMDLIKNEPFYFFIFILLPMIIFFLYALIRTIINATIYKKAKEKETVDEAVAAALAAKDNEAAQVAANDLTPEQMEQFKKFLELQKAQNDETLPAPESEPTGNE